MLNALEGDGIIENIYHFLWTKDTIFNTEPNIKIPHTILYKYQKPCYWYFTSVKDHKLKKKTTGKINNDHIREVFTKKISESGIVAYYIYKKHNIASKYEIDKPSYEKILKTIFLKNKPITSESNCSSGYIIEYLDEEKFDEFLNGQIVFGDGLLQKFEDPNERAVTYDGEEFQTRTEPLKGTNLPDQIEKAGMNIANHISNITLEKIKIIRMILNFKVNKKGDMLFLFCSSLRVDNGKKSINRLDNDKLGEYNKIKLRTSDEINIFKFHVNGRKIEYNKDCKCPNCDYKIEKSRLCPIKYKTLIESHEFRKRDKTLCKIFDKINMTSSGIEVMPYMENKTNSKFNSFRAKNYKNFIIPKVIAVENPKMKFEEYFRKKKEIKFGEREAYICDSCYLDITRFCKMGGANIENIIKAKTLFAPRAKSSLRQNFSQKKNERPQTSLVGLYGSTSTKKDKFEFENRKNNFDLSGFKNDSNKKKVRNFDSFRCPRPISSFPKKKYDFFSKDKDDLLLLCEDLKD